MSLWAEYVEEREGKSVIENDKGFILYSFAGDMVYIEDIYIKPEFRRSGVARQMTAFVLDLARAKGCTKMVGSVSTLAKNKHENLMTLINYGMKLDSATVNMIYLVKDI